MVFRSLVICAFMAAAPAMAGTERLPTVYDFGSTPYATGPAGTAQTSLSGMVSHVHGYISGGISSRGGSDLSAGLIAPLVPGKLNLIISAGTSQTGTLLHPPGTKGPAFHAEGYQATLDYHPDPDWDLQVGVSQQQFKAR